MLKFKRLEHGNDLPLPAYKSAGAAGMDICSAVDFVLYPKNTFIAETGFAIEIPHGYEVQVRSRSGMASDGISVLNAPGTIDSDYRGEVKVILHNHGSYPYRVRCGDRMAQLVVAKVETLDVYEVDDLSSTERGENGLGSTGK